MKYESLVLKTPLKWVFHPSYWHPTLGSQPIAVGSNETYALSPGGLRFPFEECFDSKEQADRVRQATKVGPDKVYPRVEFEDWVVERVEQLDKGLREKWGRVWFSVIGPMDSFEVISAKAIPSRVPLSLQRAVREAGLFEDCWS